MYVMYSPVASKDYSTEVILRKEEPGLHALCTDELLNTWCIVDCWQSFAPPPCRTVLYFRHLYSLFLCGTISMTLCLMVWDWRILRPGSLNSCWSNQLSLSSLPGLVVWKPTSNIKIIYTSNINIDQYSVISLSYSYTVDCCY